MKYTLLIFGLLWALGASGQIYIDSYRFGAAPSAGLLLDDYPNAAVAYSLRLLRTAYTGDCVEVRRVSDGTTSNIGFSGGVIDTAALKTFCSGTNCFVRTWYDQSGNARDVQMTTDANQPQIVASGVVLRRDGEPIVAFDGSNDRLTRIGNFLSSTSAASMFVVTNFDNASKGLRDIIGGLSDNTGTRFDFLLLRQSGNAIDFYIEGEINSNPSSTTITDTNERLYAAIYSNTVRRYIYANAVLLHNYTGAIALNLGALDDATQFDLGTEIGLSAYLDGNIKELIIWPNDQDANRAAIETAINLFYTTY